MYQIQTLGMAKTVIYNFFFLTGAALCFLLCSFMVFHEETPLSPRDIAIPASPLEIEADSLCISYIGNMGVLIGSNNDAVLIDGFHKKYRPAYSYPTESTVEQIIDGKYQKFGKVDMALITHHHKDHFDSEYYKVFLLKNAESKVIGPQQVNDQIRDRFDGDSLKIENALEQVPYKTEESLITHHGVSVRAFKCPHVNPVRHTSVQNIGYIIYINNYTILHLGDTNWDVVESFLRKKSLPDKSLDIAILPYWMLLDKSSIGKIHDLIAAKQIIATHIPPDFDNLEYEALKNRHPNATLFTRLNEKLIYKE